MLRRMIIFLLALCCAFAGYAYAETIELENGLTAERKNGYWTLLDASGHILMEKLTAQPQFRGSYAVVKLGTGIKEEGLSSEDVEVSRRGLIDDRGKICIPPEYDQMALINDSGTVAAEKNGLYGMLDANGKVLLDFKYKYINESFNGHCTVAVEDAHGDFAWGVVDEQGKMILPAEYKSIDIYPDGTMIVGHAEKIGDFEMNTLYGYMNMAGEWIIEPRFASAEPFQYGYAPVRMRVTIRDPFSDTGRARRWGLIDARGEFVLPAEFDGIDSVSEDGTVSAYKEDGEILFRLSEKGAEEVKKVAGDLVLEDYMPFTGGKVAKLNGEPTLEKRASSRHGYPRLDGATALFPVYAAVVEAVYPDETRYEEAYAADKKTLVTCTKTNKAYDRLIAGEADIIFCAGPSDAQIAAAAAKGVEFELTPFGKEAFVFIVNKDNPLENITVEQIQQVYSGQITQWDALNVSGLDEIIAYQRPDNSGSQTALERLMGDIPIMDAPSEYIPTGMEDILENIEYRNLPNAIGYTFRFFCTEMVGSDVKLLGIDGAAPTIENIRSDAYPITSTLYMVTRKGEDNPNVQSLMDWVLSAQGRELIEKSGYVAME